MSNEENENITEEITTKIPGNKKRNLIIGVVSTVVILIGFTIFFSMDRLDESNLAEVENDLENNMDSDLTSLKHISIRQSDETPIKVDGNDLYDYTLYIDYDDQIYNDESIVDNDDEGAYLQFDTVTHALLMADRSNLIKCGESIYCNINSIMLTIRDSDSAETYNYIINDYEFGKSAEEHTISAANHRGEDFRTLEASSDSSETNSPDIDTSEFSDLEIVDKDGTIDGDYIYVSGAVKNNGDSSVSSVRVKVNYMDEEMSVIDTDWTYAVGSEGLNPGEQTRFEVMTNMQGSNEYSNYSIFILDE